MSKTHYRKVFKSDHLGVADLEDFAEAGSDLCYTISHVKQEIGVRVAGKKGDHNIAYFKEGIKPIVLNAGNSSIVKGFSGGSPFVEDWVNIAVQFYVDKNVRFGSDTVSGVRIHPKQPRVMTQKEYEEIFNMLESTGANKQKFFAFFKIKDLQFLPGSKVQTAISMLKSKVDK